MKRIRQLIILLVSACGCVAIMVWSFGSWHGFFSDPARTAIVVVLLLLTVVASLSTSSGLGAGVREDKSNRWIFVPFAAVSVVLLWLSPYLDAHNEWVWGGETVRWIGVALTLVGGSVRLAPVFELGHRFSGLVAIQKDHTLKTDGLYRTIRHPSYLGLIVSTFAWELVFRCVALGLITTAVTVAILVARMNSEEKLLSEQFGDEYAAYRARTWRLVPWVY